MKQFNFLFVCMFANSAMAHEDHALGEGITHNLFHAIFLFIAVAVVFKGISWLRSRNQKFKDKV